MEKKHFEKNVFLLQGLSGAMVFLFGVGCIILLTFSTADATVDGTVLTNEQMMPIFGDGTNPCVKSFQCEDGFTEGASDCARCSGGEARKMCCPLGNETTCDYSATPYVCGTTIRWKGPITGTAGSCATCNSSNYQEDGTCASMKNAEGGNCPP